MISSVNIQAFWPAARCHEGICLGGMATTRMKRYCLLLFDCVKVYYIENHGYYERTTRSAPWGGDGVDLIIVTGLLTSLRCNRYSSVVALWEGMSCG